MNDEELIDSFNHEVGNTGWTNSRAFYLKALKGEFDERNYDYSEIGENDTLSLKNKIYLQDKKIKIKG